MTRGKLLRPLELERRVFGYGLRERVDMAKSLDDVQDDFIAQWGALGSAWGTKKAMAQIHALLMATPDALSTDEVMARLSMSRGNAHTNLKELVSWGIVRSVVKPGDRKEYFESTKDPWSLFCTVARERRRREVEPTLLVLRECMEDARALRSRDGQAFYAQIKDLTEFVELADRVLERLGRSEQSFVMKWAMRLLG